MRHAARVASRDALTLRQVRRAGLEVVNESPDRAGWPRRPPRKARRRVIAGGYGEEEQRRAAGCIGRPATGGDSFTASERLTTPPRSSRHRAPAPPPTA